MNAVTEERNVNERIAERVKDLEEEIQNLDQREALNQIWGESDELEKILHQHHPFMAAAGNIGMGKTTATRVISKFGRARRMEEPVEENFLLQTYYSDMKKYSFPLQIQLINERLYSQVLSFQKYPQEAFISDRSIYEDTEIFCEAFVQHNLMEAGVRDFLRLYLRERTREVEQKYGVKLVPDLIFFLKGKAETGWERTLGRKRGMELREDAKIGVGLPREFYETLYQQYEQFPERLQQHYQGPLLILPQDKVGVADATNSKGQLYVVKSVKEALKIVFEH